MIRLMDYLVGIPLSVGTVLSVFLLDTEFWWLFFVLSVAFTLWWGHVWEM